MNLKFSAAIILTSLTFSSYAGNKERIGQAGASELLINPWAGSSGWAGANTATAMGVEAMNLNISGLTFINRTQLNFSHTTHFAGSGINIISAGLAQRVGEFSVIGGSIMTMNIGDIPVTKVDQPDGGLGTFSPQLMNISIGFARTFSNSIHGGGGIRIISESISNVKAQGVALEAGIRYVTGRSDRLKFGIALRNVGPKMQFEGDGFATTVLLEDQEFTLNQRSEGFELPALLNIGASYDIYFGTPIDSNNDALKTNYRLTLAGNFTSNSFSQDQFLFGAEFGFTEYFAVRAGLVYENDMLGSLEGGRINAYTGPTLGATARLPIGSEGSAFALDYSYRFANPLGGSHCIGLRIDI